MASSIHIHTPGRICLFGDHQDYLGLPVIACAFDKGITLKAHPNDLMVLDIHMPDIQDRRTINIQEPLETNSDRDYFISALRVVQEMGIVPNRGFDIQINGNLPINAGVSSSSAVVVSWIHFLLKAYGSDEEINSELIGELAYQAEVVEFNEPGGKMDQYTCSLGSMLFLETGDRFSFTEIPSLLDEMVLGNSGIKKQTLAVLSEARTKAEEAIQLVKVHHPEMILKNIKVEDIHSYSKELPKSLQPFFKAAITNHAITQAAFNELQRESIDMEHLGQLMSQHHNILRDILKITVPIIDLMIDAALESGAYGAKIVGSGGGGCIVAMAPKGKEQIICDAIMNAGAKEAYPIHIATGTQTL